MDSFYKFVRWTVRAIAPSPVAVLIPHLPFQTGLVESRIQLSFGLGTPSLRIVHKHLNTCAHAPHSHSCAPISHLHKTHTVEYRVVRLERTQDPFFWFRPESFRVKFICL